MTYNDIYTEQLKGAYLAAAAAAGVVADPADWEADNTIISGSGHTADGRRLVYLSGAVGYDVERNMPTVTDIQVKPAPVYVCCPHCGNDVEADGIDLPTLTCKHCGAGLSGVWARVSVPALGLHDIKVTRQQRTPDVTALHCVIEGEDYTVPDTVQGLGTILAFLGELK